MPIDPSFAGLFATGVTKALDTKFGEKICHHVGNGTIKDEERYKREKLERDDARSKRHSSGSSSDDADYYSDEHRRRSSSHSRRHPSSERTRDASPHRRHSSGHHHHHHHHHHREYDAPRRPPAQPRRLSSQYYNPEQRGSRRTGSNRKHRRPRGRRISDADLAVMADDEQVREESLAQHERKMDRFREDKKRYEP